MFGLVRKANRVPSLKGRRAFLMTVASLIGGFAWWSIRKIEAAGPVTPGSAPQSVLSSRSWITVRVSLRSKSRRLLRANPIGEASCQVWHLP